MIAYLTGTLTSKEPAAVVVETSGIGYRLMIPVSTYSALPETGQSVTLHTYQYVREDTLALFGFHSPAEHALFTQLLSVSGIGPKVALAILSLASPADIRAAIAAGDTAFITSVPGIGKKTAERVVVDLRDAMGTVATESGAGGHSEVVQALVGLGYSNKEAHAAVRQVGNHIEGTDNVLRAALRELAA